MAVIGIDLGTTNSLVSCFVDNKCVVIPNSLGNNLTPSVVSVLKNGDFVVGEVAKERLITHPFQTVTAFKSHMGTNKVYKLDKYSFSPAELSYFILKSLKSDAEAFLKTKITEAVITVPGCFNDYQRHATIEAGYLAGFKVVRLINEPTAAALAYKLFFCREEKKFIVLDLGGGTLDISVVDLFENVLEVKATSGKCTLGGDDFDECLVNHYIEHFNLTSQQLDAKALSALKKQAEICRISFENTLKAEMSCIFSNKRYTLSIADDDFEALCHDLLLKLKQLLQKAFRESSIPISDIDDLILVGGATKMPLIRSFTERWFGKAPLVSINSLEVVGIGAGIYAYMKERNKSLEEIFLTDVCPYPLGVDVTSINQLGVKESGHFMPIIEGNVTIPCSRVKRISTLIDFQKYISVRIYQGENELVYNNIMLGEININVELALKGESQIDIKYTYDRNGILDVEVISLSNGEKQSNVIVNRSTARSEKETLAQLKKLEKIKFYPRNDEKNCYLLARGERIYEESSSDVRKQISAEVELFKTALNRQKPDEIIEATIRIEKFFENFEDWGQ